MNTLMEIHLHIQFYLFISSFFSFYNAAPIQVELRVSNSIIGN